MRRITSFLSSVAFLAFGFVAQAADMPVKAVKPPPLPLFYGGSGTYCGVLAGAAQTKVGQATAGTAAVPVSGASIYAAGGLMSLTCGYTMAIGPDRWAAIEVGGNASNADATATTGANLVNVSRRYSFDLTAIYGAPASILSGLFSNATTAFGALPGAPCAGVGCVASNVHLGILGAIHYGQTDSSITAITTPGVVTLEEKHNKLRFDLGVVALTQVTQSTVWRSEARWTFGSQDRGAGFLFVPGAPVSDGGTLTLKTGLIYAMTGGL